MDFGHEDNPLSRIDSQQSRYMQAYLRGVGAKTVLVEQMYFDRDFLDEYAAFYAITAAASANHCVRLHFFSRQVSWATLGRAAGGSQRVRTSLQDAYLGFSVLRPIHSPFGRTVLKWWPQKDGHQRIMKPSRRYECHLLGMTLTVDGLAWQQQDQGVGACATIALWTMLHSSAYEARFGIPTTAEITRSAHRGNATGGRMFPSLGLTPYQMAVAIKECRLAPDICEADVTTRTGEGFSRRHFCAIAASLLRSGYPVLLSGQLLDTEEGPRPHAVVVVGMRAPEVELPPCGSIQQDSAIKFVHVHDDNCGPAVRMAINVVDVPAPVPPEADEDPSHVQVVDLVPRSPGAEVLKGYPPFRPTRILAAVHDEIRINITELLNLGVKLMDDLTSALPSLGLAWQVGYWRLSEYIEHELGRVVRSHDALRRARLALVERAPLMSLHLAVIRVGRSEGVYMDVVMDTTGGCNPPQVFCTLLFVEGVDALVHEVSGREDRDFGVLVAAY